MTIFDPKTGENVIIDFTEAVKRIADRYPVTLARLAEAERSPPPQRDYGDETDISLDTYEDGTRDRV